MSNIPFILTNSRRNSLESKRALAETITHRASRQTFYTVRFLADRDLRADAYRAYGYFRWLDDQLDQGGMKQSDHIAFAGRQKSLMDRCYQGNPPCHLSEEESMLVELIRSEGGARSGLEFYIRNMMAVMAFDAERRGRLISAYELNEYTRNLAIAVTEAMHYFIGHASKSPQNETRYLAVTAAHITHMLRDTLEDVEAGYFNIPREYVDEHHIDPHDVQSDAYRVWIKDRVALARACFKAGRGYLARVENLRCRLAGFAYTARFVGVLSAIEHDDYHLRPTYPECKSWMSALSTGWSAITSVRAVVE
ncbi:MAG: squalene/phytoene synthase family protein [Chloroflexi bacterium]|nr:squalene/phytoene synthase family protein [Chloroflexota bacterium]